MSKERVEPKFKGVTFGRIMITSDEVKSNSGIIMSASDAVSTKNMSDIQTVIAVGPMVKVENGLDLKIGDKVLLDISAPKFGVPIGFNKITGEISKPSDTEHTCDIYYLIESRSVLMVL
jgi:co-chaperonin GroES (HSP10)